MDGILRLAWLSVLIAGCADTSTFRLRLAGAQIPVELTESWLHESKSPRFDVTRVAPIYLSQQGFEALRDGRADLACTDRPIAAGELKDFGAARPAGRRIGFYGFALYVHPSNRVESIFAGHLSLLFQHKISDWRELGGRDGAIRLIGPKKSTRGGTVLMQQARIWFAQPTWEALDSDHAIVDAVAADPLALGFAAIGLDNPARYLGLRMERSAAPAFPSLEEIESERYGLAKVIYLYTASESDAGAQAALDFLFSEAGGAALQSTGVWPIPRERSAVATP